MSWFSKRKVAVEEPTEEMSVAARLEVGVREPFKARVIRMFPEEHNGIKISGDIQPTHLTGLRSLPDLREAVAKVAGGGKYEAKLFEDKVGGVAITDHRFVLTGEPKIAGKVIEPQEPTARRRQSRDDDDEPEEVVELKRKEMIEEARHEAELARQRREQELAPPNVSTGDSSDVMAKLAEMEAAREKQQLEFEARLEAQRTEFQQQLLEQQREAERREDRARQDQKIDALQGQITQLLTQISAGKNDTSSIDLMKMMKQSSDENLKLLVSILSKSSDEKLSLSQMNAETLTKTFQAGISAGSGRISEDEEEEQPKDLAGVVNAQVGKVIDLVGQYVMNRPDKKAPMTEAEVAAMSQKIAATIRSEQSAANERQLARVKPAAPVQAPAQAPAETPKQDAKTPDDPGRRMNHLLRKLIHDARAGRATQESIVADAQRFLSPEVLAELVTAFNSGGADQVFAVMRKYGDSRLVDEAYKATTEASEPAAEESQPQVAGQPNAPVTAEHPSEE